MRIVSLFLFALLLLSACARFPEEEVKRAKLQIEAMYYAEVPKYLPEEWQLLRDVWQKLDEAERERDRESALRWYSYVIEKSEVIDELIEEKKGEMVRKKREEEEKREREEQKKQSTQSLTPIEREKEVASIKKQEPTPVVRKKKTIDEVRYKIEKRFPSFYTVRDEESLEEVAALPNIYNDKYYWPLLYKYNRNQVADPRRLYRGQILKVPRNITLEDIYKAREEAKAKNPRILPKTAFTPDKYKRFIEELLAEE